MGNKFYERLGNLLGWLFVIFIASFFFGYPVKWLWNYTMPSIFGLPEIGIWKAIALYWLCSILFRQKVTINKKDF